MRDHAARVLDGATSLWLSLLETYFELLERLVSAIGPSEPRTDP